MHHPTDRITHTTAFVTPVVEHWLEREIAQWVHPMKDRSDDPSHHERTHTHTHTHIHTQHTHYYACLDIRMYVCIYTCLCICIQLYCIYIIYHTFTICLISLSPTIAIWGVHDHLCNSQCLLQIHDPPRVKVVFVRV